jgi:hypothetical protein
MTAKNDKRMSARKLSSRAVQLNLFDRQGSDSRKASLLRVWYGFTHITSKVAKKRALQVIFENEWHLFNDEKVSHLMYVACKRRQTEGEAADGAGNHRMFTSYSLFLDDKPFQGDIAAVLQANYEADKNNVSSSERERIKKQLFEKYEELRRMGTAYS